MEQRTVIKFHSKLGKNASETFWLMQQVYAAMIEKVCEYYYCQTITGAYYLELLKCLMARIRRIRSNYRDPETWSLLHDND